MPKDYNLNVTPPNAQRRPQNAMDDEWTRQFLLRAQVGHVATLWDDQPFITPTNFWYDPERHEIYFHSNVVGRVRANAERHERVCFEASEFGRFLPSNVALEFSSQYQSAIVFGKIRVLEDDGEKRRVLVALIGKYFPTMTPGKEYRPITEQELKRTSVYAIAIESWSGKRNWKDRAEQSDEWAALSDPHPLPLPPEAEKGSDPLVGNSPFPSENPLARAGGAGGLGHGKASEPPR